MNEYVSPGGDTRGSASPHPYIEKTSPMKFPPIRMVPPISSPMDTEKTSPMDIAERPSDECRDKPSDDFASSSSCDEKTPPMNIGERLSDERVEDPSDEDVRGALRDLVDMTRCECHYTESHAAWNDRCVADLRPDVTLVARVLGYVVIDGEDGEDVVRRAYPSPVTADASTVAVTATVTGGAGDAVPWWGVRGPTWP